MKKTVLILVTNIVLATSLSAQFGGLINKAESAAGSGGISQSDAGSAIKEALNKGIKAAVDKVSAADGYFANAAIKVLMPKEAQKVESTLRKMGQGDLIDRTILQMNRSAEKAATKASPIFIDAITKLTITDALSLVQAKNDDACTQYLKKTTTEDLVKAFKPVIKEALDATKTTELWAEVMGTYNKVPFVSRVNTDLPDYVTRKAIDGLFYMVAKEEAKIRRDPAGQASEMIKKVFGSVLGK